VGQPLQQRLEDLAGAGPQPLVQRPGRVVYWFREKIGSFADYQEKTGLDQHSLFAKPKFVDEAGGDYRLAPDSPRVDLGPGGGSVGGDLLGFEGRKSIPEICE